MTYEDLFEIFDDIILFKLVFDSSSEWIFGRLFLEKYMFSYNDASKKISFYNTNFSIKNKGKKESKIKFYFEIASIIILVFIFGLLGFFIGKLIYKKYRKDANELEDLNNENLIN